MESDSVATLKSVHDRESQVFSRDGSPDDLCLIFGLRLSTLLSTIARKVNPTKTVLRPSHSKTSHQVLASFPKCLTFEFHRRTLREAPYIF